MLKVIKLLLDCYFNCFTNRLIERIIFIIYAADLAALIQRHGLLPHADDTQIVGSCHPTATDTYVANWMSSNRLKLNASKSEVMRCCSSRRRHQIPSYPFRFGSAALCQSNLFVTSDCISIQPCQCDGTSLYCLRPASV